VLLKKGIISENKAGVIGEDRCMDTKKPSYISLHRFYDHAGGGNGEHSPKFHEHMKGGKLVQKKF